MECRRVVDDAVADGLDHRAQTRQRSAKVVGDRRDQVLALRLSSALACQ